MIESQVDALAGEALEAENFEALGLLVKQCSAAFRENLLIQLADEGKREQLLNYVQYADADLMVKLMETAVDQGNFEAIDMLDALI